MNIYYQKRLIFRGLFKVNRFFRIMLLVFSSYLSVCLIAFPKDGLEAGAYAITLCLSSVIPALFPYLISSGCFSSFGAAKVLSRYLSPIMRPLFGIPGCGAISFVLGMVSGYPIGAVCANDLYTRGQCTKREAERMLAFCNNSGPLFVMSIVGVSFLKSPHLGILLYISHIMSAVLTGIIFRTLTFSPEEAPRLLPQKTSPKIKNTLQTFGGIMDSSVFTMLKICGFIIFFTVFSMSLPKTLLSPYIHSLLEITGGLKSLSVLEMDLSLKLPLISFFVAFSGLSVMLQVGAITSASGLSLKPYVLGKLIQGVLSFFITRILISKLPLTFDVFKENAIGEVTLSPYSVFSYSFFMLIFAVLLLGTILALCRIRRSLD